MDLDGNGMRPVTVEIVFWPCTASAILIGDIANQFYEVRLMRPRTAKPGAAFAVAAE
jgi:hypothetical protein